MLLAQFVTRTAVTFAVTLHGFTEPVLKLLYGVLAWSAFSHFLPCLLYQFLPKPQFVVGIERHRLYHLPQAASAHRNGCFHIPYAFYYANIRIIYNFRQPLSIGFHPLPFEIVAL
jgi:hypothetical protein